MSQVTRISAKVQNLPVDTTGMVTYNHNTYKYRFPESGKHEYELAVDRGDINWVPIELDTKAYATLESKVPNAVKAKLEEPSLWEKVKNKILAVINQKEYGGTMNYSNYLQDGGLAQLAPQIGEEELVQLVKEVMSGNQEAAGILKELLQVNPQLKDTVSQITQNLQQQAQSMKCGGRVKKKALGSKITPKKIMAKGGCPCMIKKVGGRLIEVDSCTGLPVHRSGGMVKKYQDTPGPITYAKQATEKNTVENNLTAAISDSFRTGNVPNLNGDNVDAGSQTLSNGQTAVKVRYTNGKAYPVYEFVNENGLGLIYNPDQFVPLKDGTYAFISKNGNLYFNNGRYKDTATGKMSNYDPLSFFDRSPNSISALRAHGFLMGPLSSKQKIDNRHEDTTTWRDTFGAGKSGKFGGKTYDEALALQNEMLNADWFNANLGTTGISGRGDDGMWGATSQKEYARYLAEKQRREEQAAAAAAAEAERQELNNLQASSIRRTTSDGMTNEALLAMDAGKAMSTLSRPDYERWMKLNQYQQGRNASLVYNGKRYDDETAYNAAVDAETARTAPKLDMLALLNTRGRRKRNAAYAQYQASMDKHVANNPLYSGPKALTQEQLSATSFKNGGQLNYANYLN